MMTTQQAPEEGAAFRSREQHWMEAAATRVMQVRTQQPEDVQKLYGGLCHNLPYLLLRNGLCQTVAFIEEKAGMKQKPREKAYALLLSHIAATVGAPPERLRAAAQTCSAAEYMRVALLLLDAWVYYKRFAVSVLNVQPGSVDIEEEPRP